jgi:acylphosphatase
MRSRWIEHNGKKIFYQDFSNLFYNTKAVKEELANVQGIVLNEPESSVRVLSNFTNTEFTSELMPIMNEASKITKSHVRKTAVLGISGIKRTFGELLSRITGQPLMYFSNEFQAMEWLAED